MTKRQLICTCCGGYAGSYKQWWNQDTGYGMCKSCADHILSKGRMSVQEFTSAYGKANIHREQSDFEASQVAGMQSTVSGT